LNPEEREKWARTRVKGQNRFLLTYGLAAALGATLATVLRWLYRRGLSTSILTDSDFLIDVGLTFLTVYGVLAFFAMLKWRKHERAYTERSESKGEPTAE
jgi:hypothetical protein